MALPNSTEVGKFQQLILKSPLGFVAAVFFLMFGITYFINIRKNDSSEENWKELYLKEKADNDALKLQLLINSGVLKQQDEVIKDAKSTLKKETAEDATEILKSRENEK